VRKRSASSSDTDARWLLLIHQIPPKPNYLRVKVWRRLQRLGAVALKNSVYVLPRRESTLESFHWMLREIVADGGEATLCEAHFVEGMGDDELEGLFHAAREADYAQIAIEARAVGDPPSEAELARLRKRLTEIGAIDFFGAQGRSKVEALLDGLDARMQRERPAGEPSQTGQMRARTWVTRKGIHVDRIASAWLIRRFIDSAARFKFVDAKTYKHRPGDLRFDMFEGEYTHEGDQCSFEVLLHRLGPRDDGALRAIAEIIHDLDLDDEKYARPAAAGVGRLLAGIAAGHAEDDARLDRGGALLDDLYESFKRKP
jgi:hypothetical protein